MASIKCKDIGFNCGFEVKDEDKTEMCKSSAKMGHFEDIR